MVDNKIITLENMKNMDIDQIVGLYRNGYKLDDIHALQICPEGCINQNTSLIGIGIGGIIGFLVARAYAGYKMSQPGEQPVRDIIPYINSTAEIVFTGSIIGLIIARFIS